MTMVVSFTLKGRFVTIALMLDPHTWHFIKISSLSSNPFPTLQKPFSPLFYEKEKESSKCRKIIITYSE
jgi:hypothetical protein